MKFLLVFKVLIVIFLILSCRDVLFFFTIVLGASFGISIRGLSTTPKESSAPKVADVPSFIQPKDADLYRGWIAKNQKYGFDVASQYEGLMNGTKNIKDVIAEQNEAILSSSKAFESRINEDQYYYEGVQGDITPDAWLKNHTVSSLKNVDLQTLQGVQGLNCEHFKVWLENCSKHSFLHCDNQLDDVREGRKTLKQIFEEQELLIAQVAEDYKASHQGQQHEHVLPEAVVLNESQKDRLKKAVQQYGSTVIVFHISIALMSLGGFYMAVSR